MRVGARGASHRTASAQRVPADGERSREQGSRCAPGEGVAEAAALLLITLLVHLPPLHTHTW